MFVNLLLFLYERLKLIFIKICQKLLRIVTTVILKARYFDTALNERWKKPFQIKFKLVLEQKHFDSSHVNKSWQLCGNNI